MPDVEAVSSSPTCGVPLMVGVPVAAVFLSGSSAGPATVADGLLLSCRRFSPRVQIALETWQSRPAGSVIVTSVSESGSTVISHRSWRPSTRRAPVTWPPCTVNESSRIDRKPIPISSLKTTRKRNALAPSCDCGRRSKLAVSADSSGVWVSGPGPLTMCAAPSDRGWPSDVQTAPAASQSAAGARDTDNSSRVAGVTVITHTPVSASTRAAPVTAPPATVRTRVRITSGVTTTASLNTMRKVKAVWPSCASGSPSKAAVSGSASPPGDERPEAVTVTVAEPLVGWGLYSGVFSPGAGDTASPRR